MTPNETQLFSINEAGNAAAGQGMALLMLKYLRAAIARWEELRTPSQLERTNQELARLLVIATEALETVAKLPVARSYPDGPCLEKVDMDEVKEALRQIRGGAAIKPNPTTDADEMAEFEAWAESPDGARYDICLNRIGPSGGMYHYIDTRMVFSAWQAARKGAAK